MLQSPVKIEGEAEERSRDQVNAILGRIRDPHGVITPELANGAQDLISVVSRERVALAVPPYEEIHKWILLNELVRAADDHKGRGRDSGEPYVNHCVRTAQYLVADQGLTGVPTLVAGLMHDSVEDKKREMSQLIRFDEYGVQECDLPENIRNIRGQVVTLVDGVTKIERDTHELTAQDTLAHLLRTMRASGLRVANVKLADRTDNMDTIKEHKDPQRQVEITRFTEDIYVLLAYVLRVRRTLSKLVDSCVNFDNPQLLNAFNELLRQRLSEQLDPFKADIEEKFMPTPDKSERQRNFLQDNVVRVECRKAVLANFALRSGKPFRSLELDDLDIGPMEPLFEIAVITTPHAVLDDVVHYVLQTFGTGARAGKNIPHDERPPKYGATVKIHSREYNGILVFRINDTVSDARAKRGSLAGFMDGVPPEMKMSIRQILERHKQNPSSIFRDAKELLLRPLVTVFTPKDDRVELPRGSTVLDFAGKRHSDLLMGLQEAVCSHHIFDRRFEQIGIFDELPDDVVIQLKSCLGKKERDVSKIKVDPGWLMFCVTEKTKDALVKKHLRQSTPDQIIERGRMYLEKLTSLFGISKVSALKAIRPSDKKKKSKEISEEEENKILFQIGSGSLEAVQILANAFFSSRKEWPLIVHLPNKPGELHQFIAEFKQQHINILEIQHEGSSAGPDEIRITVNDPENRKSPFDIMKIMLKLSYKYNLSMQCNGLPGFSKV